VEQENIKSHNVTTTSVYQVKFYLIVLTATITTVLRFNVLPEKYFFDSNYIMSLMNHVNHFRFQETFNNTAYWSNFINIFNFSSLLQWNIFYSLIFNPLLFFILKDVKIPSLPKLIWIYASIGLLNLYTFQLSKEIFQFIVYMVIFFVITKNNKNKFITITLCISILLLWGFLFRIYFIIIAIYSLMICILIHFYHTRKLRRGFIPLILIGVWLSLFLLEYIAPHEYHIILTIHDKLNSHRIDSFYANTIIIDLIPNQGRLSLFMVNYIISIIRMLFPVELLFNFRADVFLYIPFLTFQIMLSYFVFVALKSVLQGKALYKTEISLCLYFGFLLGSALFEPDFGSWIKHENTLFPLFIMFIINKYSSDEYNIYSKK